ncbi:hypothetical protein MBLNU457_6095t1 [Dothideomycetes sp. NU457]
MPTLTMMEHDRRPSQPTHGDTESFSPTRVQAPEPHLPLRKASAQKLRRNGPPHPLVFTNANGTHGFHPSTSPTVATPFYTPATVSTSRNDHLDAGQEEEYKRSFETVISDKGRNDSWSHGAQAHNFDYAESIYSRQSSGSVLKGSRSVSEGMRNLRERLQRQRGPDGLGSPDSGVGEIPPLSATEDVRTSFRSAMTSHSSTFDSYASTERSSMATGFSSNSDFVKVYPSWPEAQDEGDLSVEDAIGMYADGFGTPVRGSFETTGEGRSRSPRPSSSPLTGDGKTRSHHRSLSAVFTRSTTASQIEAGTQDSNGNLSVPHRSHTRSSSEIIIGCDLDRTEKPAPEPISRDQYGFKKVSHHITLEQFNKWETGYNEHLQRRQVKWDGLMKQYGLSTDKPTRFPPKSDKVKRYVRKGVPPAWRGAAWFWYAGGPKLQKTHEGVYFNLLLKIKQGNTLKDVDREHIERDLHRTFPDNSRFKPDPSPEQEESSGDSAIAEDSSPPEVPIIRSLRRVLQAFAVHNPDIGYCQSLNFIAGLLLLFLDEDEEKVFIMLKIVTTDYLPGTHGISLEGANVDIAVLMSTIKDTLPTIWQKLDDPQRPTSVDGPPTLPTVSLATTAWFMSLFVGTLPIESVLRVWDCLFLEGSKTLFRIALAIFKTGEDQIKAVNDPMEIFQVVQSMPRSMLDVNALMEVCFRKRGGFGTLSQDTVEKRREERRQETRKGRAMTGDVGKKRGINAGTIKGRFRSKTKGAGG